MVLPVWDGEEQISVVMYCLLMQRDDPYDGGCGTVRNRSDCVCDVLFIDAAR